MGTCLFEYLLINTNRIRIYNMISGITLIDYQEKYSAKVFFLKRAKKHFCHILFGVV